jgi:hypothetical protein
MNRPILLAYQFLIGIFDFAAGVLLIVMPGLAPGLINLHVPDGAIFPLAFVGAFVLSLGLACLYGAAVMVRRGSPCKLEVVWLLTAITRASVAIFLVAQVAAHLVEAGWLTVAALDAACVLFQAIGLRKGWVALVAR